MRTILVYFNNQMYLSLSYQIIYKALKNKLIKIYRNDYSSTGFLLPQNLKANPGLEPSLGQRGGWDYFFFAITIDMQYFKGRLYFGFSAALTSGRETVAFWGVTVWDFTFLSETVWDFFKRKRTVANGAVHHISFRLLCRLVPFDTVRNWSNSIFL